MFPSTLFLFYMVFPQPLSCPHCFFFLVHLGAALRVGNIFVFWGKYEEYNIFYGCGHKCAEVW